MMSDNIRQPSQYTRLREPGVPLYVIAYRALRAMIEDGTLAEGDKLPPEPDLARHLGVARSTVRMALLVLNEDGLIRTIHGKGSFVCNVMSAGEQQGFERYRSVTEHIQRAGMQPGTSFQKISTQTADSFVSECLQIPEGESITVILRVRTADGEPVAYTEDFVPSWVVEEVKDFEGSLTAKMESEWGITIDRAVCTVAPTKAGRDRGKLLKLPASTNLLLVSQVVYSREGRAVLFSKQYFRSDVLRFTVVQRR